MAPPQAMAKLPPLTRLAHAAFGDDVAPTYGRGLDAMMDRGVPFLVGGALAFNAHTGIWRDTKDLDLFIKPSDARAAMDALAGAGFRTETVYESWLGKAWDTTGATIPDPNGSGGECPVFIDLIWRNANGLFPVQEAWFGHAKPIDLLGRRVHALPVEELLLSKMMVGGRYRFDGADILHVLYAAGDRIDWERLARGAGEHVGLLLGYLHMYRWGYPEWADKVPLSVLDRYAELARERPSTYGPFRALLMDIQSFRVDVEGWGLPDPHKKALEDIFGDARGRE